MPSVTARPVPWVHRPGRCATQRMHRIAQPALARRRSARWTDSRSVGVAALSPTDRSKVATLGPNVCVRVRPPGRRRCGRGEPSPGADVAGVSPVPAHMWQRRAQSRCRCGQGRAAPSHRGPAAPATWRRAPFARWCPAPPSTVRGKHRCVGRLDRPEARASAEGGGRGKGGGGGERRLGWGGRGGLDAQLRAGLLVLRLVDCRLALAFVWHRAPTCADGASERARHPIGTP
jgi:hypothetical protein